MAIDESVQRYNRHHCIYGFDSVVTCHTELDMLFTARHFFAVPAMRLAIASRTRSLSMWVVRLA